MPRAKSAQACPSEDLFASQRPTATSALSSDWCSAMQALFEIVSILTSSSALSRNNNSPRCHNIDAEVYITGGCMMVQISVIKPNGTWSGVTQGDPSDTERSVAW